LAETTVELDPSAAAGVGAGVAEVICPSRRMASMASPFG
jgi:hypothetical protein